MGCCNSTHELHYRNLEGVMVSYDSRQPPPSRTDEATFIAGFEDSYMQPKDVMYVIDAKWLKKWQDYSQGNIKRSKVGSIDNKDLYSDHVNLRCGLTLHHDYLPVCIEVWEYYYTHHGGGPVIYFYVPSGFTDAEYRSGKWLNACDLSELCDVIYPVPKMNKAPYQLAVSKSSTHLGEKKKYQPVSEVTTVTDVQSDIADGNAELIAMSMLKDQARRKFTEANALDDDINKHELRLQSHPIWQMRKSKMQKTVKKKHENWKWNSAQDTSWKMGVPRSCRVNGA